MEQMSIAPDGTVYWCTRGANLNRYAPPYSTVENPWKTIAGAQIFGIALDPVAGIIYAGARATSKMYKVPLDGSAVSDLIDILPAVNGVVLGDDGAIYYANQVAKTAANFATDGHIFRVTPDGTKTQVTTTAIDDANDLSFGDGGWLYVSQWGPGTVTRIQLQGGKETTRELYVTLGMIHGDGIELDNAGNLYAAAKQLFQVPSAMMKTMVAPTAGAGIEFGCGALSCNSMFYSSGTATLKYTAPNPGRSVPWHRH
jgi:sugar lactone lactonase YvrE